MHILKTQLLSMYHQLYFPPPLSCFHANLLALSHMCICVCVYCRRRSKRWLTQPLPSWPSWMWLQTACHPCRSASFSYRYKNIRNVVGSLLHRRQQWNPRFVWKSGVKRWEMKWESKPLICFWLSCCFPVQHLEDSLMCLDLVLEC